MFEFVLRALLALALVSASFGANVPPFDLGWKLSLAVLSIALLVWRLEAREFRNSGIAGFIAAADAACISVLLASIGVLDSLGFLVLVPVAYATLRFSSPPAAMVPLASGALFVGHSLLGKTPIPSVELFCQAAGVLTVGLLLAPHSARAVEVVETPIQSLNENNPLSEPFSELKESYRKLRDSYQALERKSRREHVIAQLSEIRPEHASYFDRLATKLKEMLEVPSVAVLTVAGFEGSLVMRSATGSLAADLKQVVLPIDLRSGHTGILDSVSMALRAANENTKSGALLILDGSKVIGLICLSASTTEALHEALQLGEKVTPVLSNFVLQALEREAGTRRLKEAELLYEAASLSVGATDPTAVAIRVARDLRDLLHLDHVSICSLEDDEAALLATEGARADLLPHLEFAHGSGLEGWLNSNARETIVFSAYDDARCDSSSAAKCRVGSFLLLPLGLGESPAGYLAAATHRAGGIDVPAIETLRTIAAELGQALERLVTTQSGPEGCMTPKEFAAHVEKRSDGQIVTLEPIRLESIIHTFGRPAVALATRRFARRLRARLPLGGALTARAEGGFAAYLPFKSLDEATSWANETIAMASMIEIRTPDGSSRIPFPMRSKVAELGRQQDEVFAPLQA